MEFFIPFGWVTDFSCRYCTRSNQAWHAVFREAGLKIIRQQQQLGLNPGLYRVNMYDPSRPSMCCVCMLLICVISVFAMMLLLS